MTSNKLDAREKVFAAEYIIDLNAKRAAIEAGYAPNTASRSAYKWVKEEGPKPHVFEVIQKALGDRAKHTEISADAVVAELAKIGFASLRFMTTIDVDGQPQINLSNAPEDYLDAVAEVSTETVLKGPKEARSHVRKTRIKMHDKLKALSLLAKHTGVFDKNKQGATTKFSKAFTQLLETGSKAPIRKDGG